MKTTGPMDATVGTRQENAGSPITGWGTWEIPLKTIKG